VPAAGSDPDWTAGVKIGRCPDGFFWITHVERFRDTAEKRRTHDQKHGHAGRQALPNPRPARPRPSWQGAEVAADTAARRFTWCAPCPLAAPARRARRKFARRRWRRRPKPGTSGSSKAIGTKRSFAEIEVFPFGKHDDQVDAAADAFNELFDAEGAFGFLAMVRADNRSAARARSGEGRPKLKKRRSGRLPLSEGQSRISEVPRPSRQLSGEERLMPDPQGGTVASRSEARRDSADGTYGGSFYGAGEPIPPSSKASDPPVGFRSRRQHGADAAPHGAVQLPPLARLRERRACAHGNRNAQGSARTARLDGEAARREAGAQVRARSALPRSREVLRQAGRADAVSALLPRARRRLAAQSTRRA
jgi:hypothetical protein